MYVYSTDSKFTAQSILSIEYTTYTTECIQYSTEYIQHRAHTAQNTATHGDTYFAAPRDIVRGVAAGVLLAMLGSVCVSVAVVVVVVVAVTGNVWLRDPTQVIRFYA